MSGLMGGKTQSTAPTRLKGIQVQSSVFGSPIPMGWGTFRVAANLLWYGAFLSVAIKQKTGGKGGGSQVTGYNYSASVVMGICSGPITAIRTVYKDQTAMSLAAAGLSLFTGALGQAPWSYLSTNFAGQAIGYSGLAYVAASNYALSTSATLPNHSFEVQSTTRVSGLDDADPKDIVTSFLAAVPYWQTSWQASYSTFSTYCLASGLLLSPVLDSQVSAHEFLNEILLATNSDAVWSEGLLKIIPYGDSAATGNGVTYTPNLTPIYNLDNSVLIPREKDGDPVLVSISKDDDAWNYIQVEYLDRAQQYNTQVVPGTDPGSIDQWGKRVNSSPYSLHSICDKAVATTAAQLIVQRTAHVRRTFTFGLPWNYCLLDPMDLVSITSGDLVNVLVRITEITEGDDGRLEMKAEEMLVGTASPPAITRQTPGGYVGNFTADPQNVSAPVMINPPLALTGGEYELWIAVAGGVNWGGCEVWASWDNTTYSPVGVIDAPARYGTTTSTLAIGADPDSVNSFGVDLTVSSGTLNGATAAAADNFVTLALVGSEVIAYSAATLTATNKYTLGTYLRRGLKGTTIASHGSGQAFVRLDERVFAFPYHSDQVGKTVYLKFRSFNTFGQSYQDISTVTAYSVTLTPSTAGFTTVSWTTIGDPDPTNHPKPSDGATVNPPGEALQANDSFETWFGTSGFPGWGTAGNVTQVTSANPRRGTKSCRFTGPGAIQSTKLIPVTPGETIYVSCGLQTITNDSAGSGGANGHWSISYVDQNGAGGNFIGYNNTPWTVADGAKGFEIPITIPTGVTGIFLRCDFEIGDGSSNAVGELDWLSASRTQSGANVGATAGTDLKQSSGVVVTDSRFLNDQIGYDVNGALTNIAASGVVVRNDKLDAAYDTGGTGGRARFQLKSNGSSVGSLLTLPDATQNLAVTVDASGIIQGIGTSGIEADNSKLTVSTDAGGSGGRARVILNRNAGATPLNTVTLPDAAQNVAQKWSDVQNDNSQRPADSATAGRNLIVNGDAETGTTLPWAADTLAVVGAGCTLSASTTSPIAGSYSFLFAKAATGDGSGFALPAIKTAPGKQYVIRLTLKAGVACASGIYVQVRQKSTAPTAGFVTQAQETDHSSLTDTAGVSLDNFAVGTTAAEHVVLYTVPAGRSYISLILANYTGGSLALYVDSISIVELTDLVNDIAGVLPPRNVANNVGLNLGYKVSVAPTYSAAAGTPATATITITTPSVYYGSTTIAYNTLSKNVTGTGGTTVTYFLYVDDPTKAGGAQTLQATTTGNDIYQNDGRVLMGSIDVFFPVSGSGSGGGGGGGGGFCVEADAWVETRSRGFVRAADIERGDVLRVLNDDREGTGWEPCTGNSPGTEMLWRIASASGAIVTVSESTPIVLRDGAIVTVDQIAGQELPVLDRHGFRWEPCKARPAGAGKVAKILCNQRTYAAGDVPGRSILTHNPKP